MDLEQRVQALEQELEILKNQIQSILLDVQEQVLSNTYPGLHSGEKANGGNNTPPPPPAPRPEPEGYARPQAPVRKMSANSDYDMDDQMPSRPMDRPMQTSTFEPEYRQDFQPDYQQDQRHNWQKMGELEEWAINKIESVGVQDTADLIRAYTVKGRMTPEERDALLDFLALHVTNYPDAPTQPTRPASFDVAARARQDARATKAAAPANKSHAASSKPMKTVHAEPEHDKPASKSGRANGKRNAKVQPKDTNAESSVVLRLIAGVQNAGAGVKWRKNDDG